MSSPDEPSSSDESAGDESSDSTDQRREPRRPPYPYLPETVVNPDGPREERRYGVTRNISEHGFSASFDAPFPHGKGDVLDVRVGYQRAWAEVRWRQSIQDSKVIVGFRIRDRRIFNRED